MNDAGSTSGEERGHGIALRLADGSVYFFRKEVLDACRVTEEDSLELVQRAFEGTQEVSGYGLNVEKPSAEVVNLEGAVRRPAPHPKGGPSEGKDADEVSGFGWTDPIQISGGTYYFSTPEKTQPKAKAVEAPTSTIMCPW
jgi:hypothetical protein